MSAGETILACVVLLVWLAIHTGFAKWMILAMILESVLG